jgi:hypothetical protein
LRESLTQSLGNQIEKGLGEIILALGVSGKARILSR